MEHESDMCFNADCFKDECDVPEKVYDYSWNDSFDRWIGSADVHKYYFGDQMEPERIV